MKISKLAVTILLVSAMLIGQLPFAALAEPVADPQPSYISTVFDDTDGVKLVRRGDSVDFSLSISGEKYRGVYTVLSFGDDLQLAAGSLTAGVGKDVGNNDEAFCLLYSDSDILTPGLLKFAAVHSIDQADGTVYAAFRINVTESAAPGLHPVTFTTSTVCAYDDMGETANENGDIIGFSGSNSGMDLDGIEADKVNDAIRIYIPPVAIDGLVYNGSAQTLIEPGNVGDDVAMEYSLDGTNWSAELPEGVDAGDYPVYYRVGSSGDALGSVTSKISKAAITPSVALDDWTYGETAKEPVVTGNTGNGEVTYYYKVQGADDTTYTTTKPSTPGDYIVKAGIAETDNYLGGECTDEFSILKAAITPSVALDDWTYGETAKEPVVTGNTGNGEVTYYYKVKGADDSTYTTTKPSTPGDYVVKAVIAETDNYEGAECTDEFSILKAAITPSVTLDDWTYGETAKEPVVTGNTGNGEVTYYYKVQGSDDSTYTTTKPSTPGDYVVKAVIAETDNYEGAECTDEFTIHKAAITPSVTLDDWTYGETAKEPVVTGNTGNGEVTYYYKVKGADDSTYTTTKPSTPGDYVVKAVIAETDNYEGAECTDEFSILKAAITSSVTLDDWTYGETAKEPVVTGNTGNGEVTYYYKVKGADDSTYTTTKPSTPGDYVVKAVIAETDNYEGAECTDEFTIFAPGKLPIDPTVTMADWTEGQTPSEPVVTGNTGNGEITYYYKEKDADDSTYTTEKPTTAGSYVIKAVIAETEEYLGGECTDEFTINPKAKSPITPTVFMADWVEGETPSEPVLRGNLGNGEVTYYYKLRIEPDSAYTTEKPLTAGKYKLKAVIAETEDYYGGECTANFAITKTDGGGGGGGGIGGGGGGFIPDDDSYPITIAKTEHGTVTTDVDEAAAGQIVTVTPSPDSNYHLNAVTVTDSEGNIISVTENDDGTYTFVMPSSPVTVSAKFERNRATPEETGVIRLLNTVDHIAFINGYPDSTVKPGGNVTRAETAMMFYRLLLNQNVTITKSFSDVPEGKWYTEPVLKLASIGIINGYPDGTFKPNKTITRAEFTVMLSRFSILTNGTLRFSDVKSSYWAADEIISASTYGWIDGYGDGTFRPKNPITRAEAATVLNRVLGRSADVNYVLEHERELVRFTDLSKSAWYYYEMVEASNAHDHRFVNGNERWTAVKKKK